MGLFGFDSKKIDSSQTYLDQKSAATEGSLIGGYGADSTTAGGAILTGAEGSNVTLTAPSTTIYNDKEVAEVALRQQRKLADSFISAGQKKDDLLKTLLESQNAIAQSVATGGELGRNKTMLIVTLAVLVLVGWIFWKR